MGASKNKNKLFNSDILIIICWNIWGLHDKLLNEENQNLMFNNDIIIITETHSSQQQGSHFDVIRGIMITLKIHTSICA